MKKTIFLSILIFVMTTLLFTTGLGLLAMVEQVGIMNENDDNTIADVNDSIQSEADVGATPRTLSSTVADMNPFQIDRVNPAMLDVLRSFGTDKNEPVNILLLVTDGDANTDSMSVIHYNPNTHNVNMISIPRDTYVNIPGMSFHKINAVYSAKSGGVDKLRTALEDMLGQKINYFMYINLKTIREVVDLLDGVYYTVPCDLKYNDPTQNLNINIKKGNQLLNGKQVEGLLRYRHPNTNGWTKEIRKYYDGGDLKRIERQKDFIREAMRQKLTLAYIPKINEVINNVYENVKTDLPLSEVFKLTVGLPDIDVDAMQSETLPGEAKYIDKLSFFVHYPKETLALAETLFSGELEQSPEQ